MLVKLVATIGIVFSLISARIAYAKCDYGYEDECFKLRFTSESDIREIRSDPQKIKPFFQKYKTAILKKLGENFLGISDEGLAFIFATIVAYESIPYRFSEDVFEKRRPVQLVPIQMMEHGVALVCNEYASLVIQLAHYIYPHQESSQLNVNVIGWRKDSPTGNHAVVFISGTGVPLMLDPMAGIVARGKLVDLLQGQALILSADDFTTRIIDGWDANGRPLNILRARKELKEVYTHADLFKVSYSFGPIIYSFVASGIRGFVATGDDFITEFTVGHPNTYYLLTSVGQLWQINKNGCYIADTYNRYSKIVGTNNSLVYALTIDGILYQINKLGTKRISIGIKSLCEGIDGYGIHFLTEDNKMFQIYSNGTELNGSGVVSIAIGNEGSGLYYLSGDRLYLAGRNGISGRVKIASGVSLIYPGYGGQSKGRSVFVLKKNKLWRIDANSKWVKLTGEETALNEDIRSVILGLGGFTVNILTVNGNVRQGDLDPTSGGISKWEEPHWFLGSSTAPFKSITLSEDGIALIAIQEDGKKKAASASSY